MGTPYRSVSRACAFLTTERLAELFAYDPGTGALTIRRTGRPAVRTSGCGYLVVYVLGSVLLVHRIAYRMQLGEWPFQVDHVDGDRTNNRWANLRATDHSHNAQNQKRAMRTSATGLLGVSVDRRALLRGGARPYRAEIEVNQRKRSLGMHETPELAHAAYLQAKALLHPGCGPEASR